MDAGWGRRHMGEGAIAMDVRGALVVGTGGTALLVILRNLVNNAVKYSDPPIQVRVHGSKDARGGVRIDVIDRGIGLDPRQLQRIFQRFYRVSSGHARERKGTGLGLYVAAMLSRAVGAKLRALSGGEGTGTTMRLEFPASATVIVHREEAPA